MKAVLDIQRHWINDWLTPLATSLSLSTQERAAVLAEIRKEVFWLVDSKDKQDLEAALTSRRQKINAIADANEGSAEAFDPYFDYRRQFFTWALD